MLKFVFVLKLVMEGGRGEKWMGVGRNGGRYFGEVNVIIGNKIKNY
jgi:hypothetical protein